VFLINIKQACKGLQSIYVPWQYSWQIGNHHVSTMTGLLACPPPPKLTILIFVNNQLDTQFFPCMFISILYMFRAAMCPSSGELIVWIGHLVYVTVYRWLFGVQVCTPDRHLYGVIYTRCRIDTINSPDDGHMAARNVENRNKHTWKKKCASNWLCRKIILRCAVNRT
jgi:hypothetical protein